MTPFLLIGLGNPGSGYSGNRHNVGFMVIDRIITDYGFSKPTHKFGGSVSEGTIAGQKVYAFRPLGYMNTSGGPVGELSRFYKIPAEQMIVIHDELDLAACKIRVKRGGGNGGHNGLKSIDAHVGDNYQRIRVGIGHPGDKDRVSDYVLSDFNKAERPAFELLINEIAKHIGTLLQGDDAGFMNKIALATKETL
jgi:peptidyl-tRNA hydrolase, PTH1 family